MSVKFDIPAVEDNPSGWGPCSIPTKFKDMPYQPFSKSDRLGKISDWTGNAYQDRRYTNKYASQFGSTSNTYAYYHEEDETSFSLVDSSRTYRPGMYNRGRFFRGRGMRGGRGMYWNNANTKANQSQPLLSKMQKNKERERQRHARKWQQQQRGRQNYNRNPQIKPREASVTVRQDWVVVEEMEKVQLNKLSLPSVGEPEDLVCCGGMEYFDKAYDRINVKNEKPLKRIDRIFHTVTTTDDPIIRKLTKTETEANVFATDAILSTLMCSTKAVYSWDIVVQKIGGKIFLDKRDNTEFDLLSVSETAMEPPQDEGSSVNSPRNLALEATFINHNFSQQVLRQSEEKYSFAEPNPFLADEEDGEVASVGYRYRKWNLGNGIVLIARCEHDAVMNGPAGSDKPLFINVHALNEWDQKVSGHVDWRQKLEIQPGAVLANELKQNACKLAKWTVQAILAGSDLIKFGYITRYNMKDSGRHVILGTQHFRPSEFAAQISLSMDKAWGLVRCIVDIIMAQKDGKYLIVKDPNKSVIRLYDIPDDTFESDEENDGSEYESDEAAAEE